MRREIYLILGFFAVTAVLIFSVNECLLGCSKSKSELIFLLPPAVYRPLEKALVYFNENSESYTIITIVQSTGALINRIKLDQKGDVVGSADSEYMEKMIQDGLVLNERIFLLSYSIPAIIVPRGNPARIYSLKDLVEKNVIIGISNPDISPAGKIALDVLIYNGIYDVVKDRIVIFSDINELTRQVSLGVVPVGISWHFTYYWSPNDLEIVWLDKDEIPRIECQLLGVLTTSNNKDAAESAIKMVLDHARKSGELRRYGYINQLEDLRVITPYENVTWMIPKICAMGVRNG